MKTNLCEFRDVTISKSAKKGAGYILYHNWHITVQSFSQNILLKVFKCSNSYYYGFIVYDIPYKKCPIFGSKETKCLYIMFESIISE